MAKKKILEKFKPWIEVRRRFHPFDAHIQMARELGLNPKKFDGVANAKHKPWKLPLPEFIEELYFRHFKKRRPENVWSIEKIVRDANRNKTERKARKQSRQPAHLCHPLAVIRQSGEKAGPELNGSGISDQRRVLALEPALSLPRVGGRV
jgi:hypothetical protein